MRGRSSNSIKLAHGDVAALTAIPGRLARFNIDERWFEVVLYKQNDTHPAAAVVHFDINGSTVAVVEENTAEPVLSDAQNLVTRLTGRELQIAALVANGDATKNIAHKLQISEWTVGTHLRRIFAKLQVDNRAAMVYRCAPLIKGSTQVAKAGATPSDARKSLAKQVLVGLMFAMALGELAL
jgi:DNA-binding CsgD family transcriptional regulator